MRISQYMSRKVITTGPDEGVRQAFFVMRREGVRHLPVVDPQGALVGIISDRDLRRPDWVDEDFAVSHPYRLDDELRVGDLMSRDVVTVHTYDSIGKAAGILEERRFGALPVLDKEGTLVGVLSAYDLLRALRDTISEKKDV